jgi:hypothetical protein
MLVGLVLVLTVTACEVVTASGNLIATAVAPVVTVPVSDAEKVPDVKMLVHGHWCGPGHPTEEEKQSGIDLSPVDLLDSACMKHDLCYKAHGGKPACRCDEELIWRIKHLQYNVPDLSDDAKAKTFLLLGWFESSACASDVPNPESTMRDQPQAFLPDPRPPHRPSTPFVPAFFGPMQHPFEAV